MLCNTARVFLNSNKCLLTVLFVDSLNVSILIYLCSAFQETIAAEFMAQLTVFDTTRPN